MYSELLTYFVEDLEVYFVVLFLVKLEEHPVNVLPFITQLVSQYGFPLCQVFFGLKFDVNTACFMRVVWLGIVVHNSYWRHLISLSVICSIRL